ncbi:MAG: zinc-ribbon domain-containing protein [Eggerthellaceae bacterium]|nr:zinc-ribbon domain-containing protein [Eggerthellaceae bacterium]
MICPNCNAQVSDTQAFCGNCGAQLTPAQPTYDPVSDTQPYENPYQQSYQQPVEVAAEPVASPYTSSPYNASQSPYGAQQNAYSSPYSTQGTGQPYSQAPFPPGTYTQPPQQKASDTPFGLSIAGLVCAIIGLFPLGLIFAIVALVMNSKQKKNGIVSTKQAPTKVMGIIGLVLSIIWTVIAAVFGVALVAAINDGAFDDLDVTSNSNGSVTISTPSGSSVNLNSDGSVSTTSPSSGSASTSSSGSSATTSSGAAATAGTIGGSTSATSANSDVICGDWELESGSDEDLDAETMDMMRELGFNVTLSIDDDGTFEFSLFDESVSGTWKQTGTNAYLFTISGDSITGTYDSASGKLSWVEGDDKLVFRPMQ